MTEERDGSCEAGKEGGVRGLVAAGGLSNVSGTGAELGETSCSPLEATVRGARTTDACQADSGRLTARTLMVGVTAVCNKSPSWAAFSVDGGGETQRDVHTDASWTHFHCEWRPGSGQWEIQGADGWTEAESGSRRGSWSGQLAAGVGGEEAEGKGVA